MTNAVSQMAAPEYSAVVDPFEIVIDALGTPKLQIFWYKPKSWIAQLLYEHSMKDYPPHTQKAQFHLPREYKM